MLAVSLGHAIDVRCFFSHAMLAVSLGHAVLRLYLVIYCSRYIGFSSRKLIEMNFN